VAIASRSERMRASLSHLLERLFGREDRDERQIVDAESEPASRPPRHPTQKR
jgi:Arc/MetJ-type ribon-helix-helix transcriptional regulator